jgi:glyoxylase-like metal-dependent hydrolase (beta-lactamase superfamily II)
MSQAITAINLGGVNCYLIRADEDYMLIDTGYSSRRATLEEKLKDAGCQYGNLKLIILTHGDADHAGNAAYLRDEFGARIAMHSDDTGMVESGDMSVNRKAKPDEMSFVFRMMSRVMPLFIRVGKLEVFKPDLTIDEDSDLSGYGFDVSVVHLPGHSKGSIGILTKDGDLFCGDFLYNMLGFSMIDDMSDHRTSIEKLRKLDVKTIYPGHGKPFPMTGFLAKCG